MINLIATRLNRAHGLAKWNRYYLAVPDVLEQDLGIAYYQRVSDV